MPKGTGRNAAAGGGGRARNVVAGSPEARTALDTARKRASDDFAKARKASGEATRQEKAAQKAYRDFQRTSPPTGDDAQSRAQANRWAVEAGKLNTARSKAVASNIKAKDTLQEAKTRLREVKAALKSNSSAGKLLRAGRAVPERLKTSVKNALS